MVADGLVALGRPEHGYVNGIADYSLWWVVNADLYVRYFGDAGFAEREAAHVDAFVADLAEHADDGVFRPAAQRGGFVDSGPGSVFLDWGLALEHGRDPVALQMLWCWALRSAERLLDGAGHPGATRWGRLADRLESTLRSRGRVLRAGRWADYLDAGAAASPAPYANFLAVLAGLHPDGVPAGVVASIRSGTAGTPFMTAFRLRALLAAGSDDAVLDEMRPLGARCSTRARARSGRRRRSGRQLAMYGRPFGRSRCHAWSAGPRAILPEAVLGARPLADGWTRFDGGARLGDLEWRASCPRRPATSSCADRGRVSVRVPAGMALVRDDRVEHGPAVIEWSTAEVRPRQAAPSWLTGDPGRARRMEHHERALAAYVDSVRADPATLAVIAVGSVARGAERPDSDVDVYLVVEDDAFDAALARNRLSWIERQDADYAGGYVDVKLASPRVLAAAAESGDDPMRASFEGARIAFQRGPRPRPRARGDRGTARGGVAGPGVCLRSAGEDPRRLLPAQADEHGDAFLVQHAATHLASRPPVRRSPSAVPSCADPSTSPRTSPRSTCPTGSSIGGVARRTACGVHRRADAGRGGGLARPRLDHDDTLSTFIRDNELAWLLGTVPPEYR